MHSRILEPSRRRNRTVHLLSVLTILIASVAWVISSDDSRAWAADVAMTKPVYGANEAVVIAVGMTDYIRNCEQKDGQAVPVNDWIYAVSDVYVVPWSFSGWYLEDVTGEPNVVFGGMGGAFVDEVVAYTKPAGNLKPGRYGIVIDNCQDKHFDPAVDTFIPDAFTVVSDVLAPPIDIAGIKAKARERSERWMGAEYTFTGLVFAANAWELWGVMTDPLDAFIFQVQDAFVRSAGLPDAKAETRNLMLSTARHWGGIAADPPDYAYDQPASPGMVPNLESHDTDPMLRSQVALGQQAAVEDSLANGLLESIEKYQGAARDRNGVWARQQAYSARHYALALSQQLPRTASAASQAAAALRADSDDLDTIMHSVGDMLIDARSNGLPQEVRTRTAALGMTPAQLEEQARKIDNMALSGISKADAADGLDILAAQTADLQSQLADIIDNLSDAIDQLDADPMMTEEHVIADAGGPYSGTPGSTVALDASRSSGTGTLTYEWDLDGDGVFDDATGSNPTFTVAASTPPLLSVKVTGAESIASIATAAFTNLSTDPHPQITGHSPTGYVVDMVAGESRSFSVSASNTGGGPVAINWWVNGSAAGSGGSFTLTTTSGEFGSRMVDVIVTDSADQMTSASWWVRVSGTDDDGDGWPVPLDCDDTASDINPGMPDIANGIDDDCDPSTSDGTPAPTVNITSGDTSLEGIPYQLQATISGGSGTIHRSIDWGDGTPVQTGSVTAANFNANPVPHTYTNDGTYTIKLCGRTSTSPDGCAYKSVTVANQAPTVNFVDLTAWTPVTIPATDTFADQGNANWVVSDTRDSVVQINNSDPSVFMSPDSYVGTETTVRLSVETYSDDDFIGFVIGASPDMFTDDPQHYLLIDWKQGTQLEAPAGLAVSEVHGVINGEEIWKHVDRPASTGTISELARGATLGNVGWGRYTVYDVTFRYTTERLQVWVDGSLELDVTGDFPTDARFGFYNNSQDHVRYQNFAQTSTSAPEGTLVPFNGFFQDPGKLDTHSGLFSWGDGSPDDRVEVISSTDGFGEVTASHRYLDDGTYPSELCITDDAGDTGCAQRSVRIHNVAPVTSAGRNRVAGPKLVLDDSRFTDLGVADTHTATVDWGDGSPVEVAAVSEDMGSGMVSAAHHYSADGTMTVTICVTDDDGDSDCDSFEVTIRATNGLLESTGEPDTEVYEGDLVPRQVAFEDENPSDTHSGSISWGDGRNSPLDVQDGGSVGVGSAVHRYGDNGIYEVVTEICDDRGMCTQSRSTITVLNVPPTIEATGGDPVLEGEIWPLSGTWGDVGVDDEHVVTINWGDGTTSQVAPSVLEPGAGEFAATHIFDKEGEYEVNICVVDDDEGSSCTTVMAVVNQAPPETTTTTTPGSTSTTEPTTPTPTTTPVHTQIPVNTRTPEVSSVTPSTPVPTALPRTGRSPAPITLTGMVLVIGGLLVLAAQRRSRRSGG